MNKKIVAIILMCSFVTKCVAITDGSLDSSFGKGAGIVTTPIGNSNDQAFALILQPDGKLVAAGYYINGLNDDFALARYNSDGSLDSSFGMSGTVTIAIGSINRAQALILQPDGKLIAAGVSDNDFALVRYNSDGSLDSSFGPDGNGIVTTDFGSSIDNAWALIYQPDGKLVAAGIADNDFALARYNADGSLDTSFGTGGTVTNSISGIDQAYALILQPDGKLVAAGRAGTDFALARYNADGSLDTSFGPDGTGIVKTSVGTTDYANALILQPDGKLVAAGYADTDFALARYNPDGSLDTSFGAGGTVTTSVGTVDQAEALILQPDGKLVAAGFTNNSAGDVALVRYSSDGALDTSFGSSGIVTTSIGTGLQALYALIAQPDGKLVAAGYAHNGSNTDFALVRYLNPSLEISSLARDIRAKYRPLIPSDRNGTEYEI